MAFTEYDMLKLLNWLAFDANLSGAVASDVRNLRQQASILKVFLSCKGKWHIEDGNLKLLLTRINNVFRNADMELRRLWADLKCLRLDNLVPMDTADVLSAMVERFQLLMPDIRHVYTILSKSSRSIADFNDTYVLLTLEILETTTAWFFETYEAELVAPIWEEVEAVEKSLKFLEDFINFVAKKCSNLGKLKDLLIHAEFVVDNISCILYLCSVKETMNEELVEELKMLLSAELQRTSPAQPEVGKIYVKALKTLKLSKLDVSDFDNLKYFLDYVRSLSDTKPSSMTCEKCLIKFLCEEVEFLRTFIDKSSAQEPMCSLFWERITSLIIGITCAIFHLLPNGQRNRDKLREVQMAVCNLQYSFMLKRENARQADYSYLRIPWRFLGPSAWRDIACQLDFLENQLEDNFNYPLNNQIELIQREFLSLDEAFIKQNATQSNLHEDLKIQRRRLLRIIDHVNLVITSYKYRIVTLWSCKLELYYIIKNIRMIKMEVSADGAEFLLIVGMLEFEDQLRLLETTIDLISPRKGEVQLLQLKASFLRVFLNCRGKWHAEDENLKVILTRIRTVFHNLDLRKLWAYFIHMEGTECWGIPMYMEHILFSMQEGLRLLNPDIQAVYTILSKSSRFVASMTDEAITVGLNTILENVESLQRFNFELVSLVKNELEAVGKCLSFLRDFLCFTAKGCSKLGKLKDLLIHVEILVDNISCLLYLCLNDKLNDKMVKEIKMHLSSELQKISPAQPDVKEIYIKALKVSKAAQRSPILGDELNWGFLDSLQDYIIVLSDTKMSSSTPIRDQIFMLEEDLPFLFTYFAMGLSMEEHINGNNHQIFKELLERTTAATNEIVYVTDSFHNDMHNIYKKLSNFLYDLYFPRLFRSNFPRACQQGFIRYLLGNLKVLNNNADSVAPLKHQIEIVHEELLSVGEYFGKTPKQDDHYEELKSQWAHFVDIAYHTEFVMDSFVAGRGPLSCHKLGFLNVLEEIKTVKMKLKAIKNKITDEKLAHKPCSFPIQFSTAANLSKVNAAPGSEQRLAEEMYSSKIVIFPEAAEEIIELLTYGLEKLTFASIVGMPGIGKTTLANSVFQHPSVASRFHVRARCCVSQVYDKRRLLHEILRQVTVERNQCGYDDDGDLERKLFQSLKGRRYLILIDDIWDIQSWKEIKISFPNDENGSRIMFTSRFDYISSQAGPNSINCHLSPLSDERSWEILESKIFGGRSCPTDLVNLGREIAAKCKGVPLTVDLVAGILRGKETREWKEVAERIMEYLFDDPQGLCQQVLEISYRNLPNELRPCFLYFAAFPEDTNIRVRELISLWIAEGFVQLQKGDQRCLEDAAEEILNNLISRSLVIVSQRSRFGVVKATRVHDLLHNFASAKAKDERFMLKIDVSSLSCDEYQWQGQYRLCIYPGSWSQFLESNPFGSAARAIICSDSLYWKSISWKYGYFQLLRVLYIPEVTSDHHPAIFTLINLRLLAISWHRYLNVSEIHKLGNLETIIMNNTGLTEGCLFLDGICNMMRLRHFQSYLYVDLVCRKEKILKDSFLLDNLKTLSKVRVSYADDTKKIFKLMPNLVELKVEFYNPDGGCYPSPKLDLLKKLESLKVMHNHPEDYPCKITNFPPYLKTLVLFGFNLPWTEISEIGNLENLEILKLQHGAFVGPKWEMNDGQFPKLKYLSLERLDLKEWNAAEDHLSCLEQLRVTYCENLKKLPLCLAEVATLQRIDLSECLRSVESSAKIIKEEQEASGNYQLVVNSSLVIFSEEDEEDG